MSLDPTSIGRYAVQRALGRGAMGIVWLATDPLLKRPVAIKTLLNPGGDDVAITMERFRRESEISARLSHPNIITVFDVGSDPKVGPFLAMEYIDGVSLSTLFRKKPPVETRLRLLIQGMAGLMAAGAAGIVHRDVKPENMLVGRDGRLKLMDFGIARANESHLTQAGMVFGTPSYTAPELLKGLEANPGTDQYAFAVTCLEGLTGQLPFLGTSVASTLYKVVHEAPDLPADMVEPLRQVFLKALAKEPGDRFPDLPAFMRALTEAAPVAPEQRSRLLAMLDGDEPATGTVSIPILREDPPPPPAPQVTTPTAASSPALPFRPSKKVLALGGLAVGVAVAAWFAVDALRVSRHPLTIHSEPSGAQVFLNGKAIGTTPLEGYPIRDDRPAGLLRVELEGYLPVQAEVEADDRILEYTLHRPGGKVSLASQPVGAEILVDGVSQGQTPGAIEVPETGAEVILRLAGYQDWKATLPKEGPPPAVVVLQAATFKTRVVSDPPGAEVFVDALPVGRTPLPELELKSGMRHAVRLKHPGFEDWTGLVEPGKPLPDPIRMRKGAGR